MPVSKSKKMMNLFNILLRDNAICESDELHGIAMDVRDFVLKQQRTVDHLRQQIAGASNEISELQREIAERSAPPQLAYPEGDAEDKAGVS